VISAGRSALYDRLFQYGDQSRTNGNSWSAGVSWRREAGKTLSYAREVAGLMIVTIRIRTLEAHGVAFGEAVNDSIAIRLTRGRRAAEVVRVINTGDGVSNGPDALTDRRKWIGSR